MKVLSHTNSIFVELIIIVTAHMQEAILIDMAIIIVEMTCKEIE